VSTETLIERAKRLEMFETPRWAAEAVLRVELMPPVVLDPCCGRGVLVDALRAHDRESGGLVDRGTLELDVHDWGLPKSSPMSQVPRKRKDFLEPFNDLSPLDKDFGVFMNPPFSKAEAFVRRAHAIGARKIISFARFAWWESARRRSFWDEFTPARIHICGNRATCWRIDIPEESRQSGSSTAHAWYVWERGHPQGPVMSRLYKERGS
jgi:hypothetical protein